MVPLKFFGGLLAAAILALGAATASEVHSIVEQIAAGLPADQQAHVSDWFESVGGSTWYTNYRAQFGVPNRPLPLADVRDVTSPVLGYYYLHQTAPEDDISASCEPLTKQPGNRTIQAFCALANWNALTETGDQKYRAEFLRWADKLNDGADDGRWIWTIEIPGFALKPPWISGLTQSLGVSVLLRAYRLTGKRKYFATAQRAMAWLSRPLSKGGCVSSDENGSWIEEYPNAASPNHVLNGHMWALFGVWDYYRVTRDTNAENLFAQGVKVVEAEVDRYDTGSWIVYSQRNKLDNVIGNYMQFITEQMKALHAITGNPLFGSYAEKWAAYQDSDTLFIKMARDEFSKALAPPLSGPSCPQPSGTGHRAGPECVVSHKEN